VYMRYNWAQVLYMIR